MKNKKSMYYAVLAILFSTYSKIYPTFPRENGDDTYVYHGFSQSLLNYGEARWLLDLMSYFGLYPFSNPSGIPFLLSSVSLSTGVNVEFSILILNFFFVTVGCLSIFLLSRNFSRHHLFSFIILISFLNSFYLLKWNNWNISPRGSFICLLPLFINQVFSFVNKGNKLLNLVLLIFILILLLVTHRMSSQIIPFLLIPFLMGYIYQNYFRFKLGKISSRVLSIIFFMLPFTLILISISGYNIYWLLLSVIPGQRYIREFPITSLSNSITDLIYTYVTYANPLLFLSFFGLIYYIFNYSKRLSYIRTNEIMIVFSFIVFCPLIIGVEYTLPVILPLLTILCGAGFLLTYKTDLFFKSKKAKIYFITSLILLGNFSGFFLIYINNDPNIDVNGRVQTNDWVTFEQYNLGVWMEQNDNGEKICFDNLYSRNRISAYFDVETIAKWDIVINDNATPFMIISRLSWIDVLTYQTAGGYGGEVETSFTGSSGTPFEYIILNQPLSTQSSRAIDYFDIKFTVLNINQGPSAQFKFENQDYWYQNHYTVYSDYESNVLAF